VKRKECHSICQQLVCHQERKILQTYISLIEFHIFQSKEQHFIPILNVSFALENMTFILFVRNEKMIENVGD
jgi:hypothetical protein